MSDCVAGTKGRAFPRLTLAGLGLLFLSGCSSDVTRFSQSDSPFSNPFASNTTHAAPTPGVTTSPLAQGAPAASGTRTASLSKPQAVGGSAVGWTAAGGSPIVVANGETLDTISGRYGVPSAALLSANGLSSASEVKSGTHLVVPVYHADGHAVASAESEKAGKKRDKDVADAEPSKSAKKAKDKEKEKAAKADKAAKEAEKSASKDAKESKGAAVAEAEPSKSSEVKKPAVDKTPTGNLEFGGVAIEDSADRRAGRRRRNRAGIPLAGARPHHSGVQGWRQRWHQHLRSGRNFGSGGGERHRRLLGRRT